MALKVLYQRIWRLFSLAVIVLTFLTACSRPEALAKLRDRTFLDLSLEFLSEYQLPKTTRDGIPVGGLSGLAYDPKGSTNPGEFHLYAISDDPSEYGDARFYTLTVNLTPPESGSIAFKKVEVESSTSLKQEDGQPYPLDSINPEGIGLSPRNSIYIASEGVTRRGIPPFLGEFDRTTGKLLGKLPLPQRYLPEITDENQQQGVLNNLGFESLTLDPETFSPGGMDPYRLFAATEAPLIQDNDPEQLPKVRLLHYVVADKASYVVSEHFYQLDPAPLTIFHGLTELVALGKGGHFLSLERNFGLSGYSAKLFQVAVGGATDTSRIASLKGPTPTVVPVQKKLLLDLSSLNLPLYNLEGMVLGPRLPDGSQSLLLVSDDNFDEVQKTQFLLFRIKNTSAMGSK